MKFVWYEKASLYFNGFQVWLEFCWGVNYDFPFNFDFEAKRQRFPLQPSFDYKQASLGQITALEDVAQMTNNLFEDCTTLDDQTSSKRTDSPEASHLLYF